MELLLLLLLVELCLTKQPNILLLLVQNVGYNDVSWNNMAIHTPNLEHLARRGVILDSYYTAPRSSPSRASLLTGLYQHRLGIQRGNISPFRPTGLSTSFTLLPEILKESGYSTHLVGKWHLGYCHPSYLPTRRGFDTFFGQWGQESDHYTRMHKENEQIGEGYDLRRGEEITYDGKNEYSTHLWRDETLRLLESLNGSSPWFIEVAFTAARSPLQAPPEYTQIYTNQTYNMLPQEDSVRYGMISGLDSAVGQIVQALERLDLSKETVVVFTSDTGAENELGNLPFKGRQGSLWEGAVRVPAFVYSPLLGLEEGYRTDKLVHVTDWFPTFLGIAGENVHNFQTDGFNIWQSLRTGEDFVRNSIIYSMDQDEKSNNFQYAIRQNNYKFVWGMPDRFRVNKKQKRNNFLLFDLARDPGEVRNLAGEELGVLHNLKKQVVYLAKDVKPAFQPSRYSLGYPRYHDGTLSTGWCEADWWRIIWKGEDTHRA